MSHFWSKLVRELTPYTPGEQPRIENLIKLNTNENPYPPSPKVHEAVCSVSDETWRLYPDPDATELKLAIAEHFDLPVKSVFVGNGSDEVLAHTFHALLKHEKPILFPDVTYSFYPVYCRLYDIAYRSVALNQQLGIEPEDYGSENGGIIFPNPNAPTGGVLSLDGIRQILERNPESVVVVDEAYIDFGGVSASILVSEYPNLLVIQTLSKSRALAGLRIGFALGQAPLIEALERVKNSFNSYPLGRLAILAGVAAIKDTEYFDRTRHAIMATRERLTAGLKAMQFEVLPSAANFILVRHATQSGEDLAASLREQGILVRHFRSPRIENYLRITIGTDVQCDTLLKVLSKMI